MYQELTRELRDEEKAVLESQLGPVSPVTLVGTAKWVAVWTGGLLLCCALFVAGFVNLDHELISPVIVGLVGAIAAIAGILCLYAIIALVRSYFHWGRVHRDYRRRDVPSILMAQRDGRASVKSVKAIAVVEIEEFEDEGPGYVFDVEGGRILFLKGQRIRPVEDTMEWPNSEFEIVRTLCGDRWIGIFCSGHRLDPARIIDSSQCKEEVICSDQEELIEGNALEFAASIQRPQSSKIVP